MAPKLTKGSAARKLLLLKFKSGQISGTEDPKTVWESDPVFQDHKLSNFRTCFNNMKKELAKSCVDEEDDGEDLDRRRSDHDSKKRRIWVSENDPAGDTDEEHLNCDNGAELVSGDGSFKPLFLVSTWEEPGVKTKRATVAILLPSGIGPGEFAIAVAEGGEFLEITVFWPFSIVDLLRLHKKWLCSTGKDGYTMYHPKILGFEDALKRKRARASDDVKSIARIPLPFPVQTHVDAKYNLAWRGSSAKVVYVDLKAMAETYAIVNDVADFEVL